MTTWLRTWVFLTSFLLVWGLAAQGIAGLLCSTASCPSQTATKACCDAEETDENPSLPCCCQWTAGPEIAVDLQPVDIPPAPVGLLLPSLTDSEQVLLSPLPEVPSRLQTLPLGPRPRAPDVGRAPPSA
jgi:hypothetical protein